MLKKSRCGRRDSNPHGAYAPLVSKTSVSANCTTPAEHGPNRVASTVWARFISSMSDTSHQLRFPTTHCMDNADLAHIRDRCSDRTSFLPVPIPKKPSYVLANPTPLKNHRFEDRNFPQVLHGYIGDWAAHSPLQGVYHIFFEVLHLAIGWLIPCYTCNTCVFFRLEVLHRDPLAICTALPATMHISHFSKCYACRNYNFFENGVFSEGSDLPIY